MLISVLCRGVSFFERMTGIEPAFSVWGSLPGAWNVALTCGRRLS